MAVKTACNTSVSRVKVHMLSAVLHHPSGPNQNRKRTWPDSRLKREKLIEAFTVNQTLRWIRHSNKKNDHHFRWRSKTSTLKQEPINSAFTIVLSPALTLPRGERCRRDCKTGSCAPDVANWRSHGRSEKVPSVCFTCLTLTLCASPLKTIHKGSLVQSQILHPHQHYH